MDRRRRTGTYTHVDESGKERRIVNFAAEMKTIVTAIVAFLGLIVMLAGWFNGHVQATAIRALGHELSTDGTDVQNAFQALLDARAEEIEANLKAEMEKLYERQDDGFRRVRSTVWRATSPDRRAGDPMPTDSELDE